MHGIHDNLPNGYELAGISLLNQLEYTLLRILQNKLQALLAGIAVIGNVLVQTNHFTKHGLLCHNIGIISHIRCSGYCSQ